jgi:hypothetical protein
VGLKIQKKKNNGHQTTTTFIDAGHHLSRSISINQHFRHCAKTARNESSSSSSKIVLSILPKMPVKIPIVHVSLVR